MKAHLKTTHRFQPRGYTLALTLTASDGRETTREIVTGVTAGEKNMISRAVAAALLLAGYAVSGA